MCGVVTSLVMFQSGSCQPFLENGELHRSLFLWCNDTFLCIYQICPDGIDLKYKKHKSSLIKSPRNGFEAKCYIFLLHTLCYCSLEDPIFTHCMIGKYWRQLCFCLEYYTRMGGSIMNVPFLKMCLIVQTKFVHFT